jgi:hypothetical protein
MTSQHQNLVKTNEIVAWVTHLLFGAQRVCQWDAMLSLHRLQLKHRKGKLSTTAAPHKRNVQKQSMNANRIGPIDRLATDINKKSHCGVRQLSMQKRLPKKVTGYNNYFLCTFAVKQHTTSGSQFLTSATMCDFRCVNVAIQCKRVWTCKASTSTKAGTKNSNASWRYWAVRNKLKLNDFAIFWYILPLCCRISSL